MILIRPSPFRLVLLLAAGSVAVSFASIFVRLAAAPPLSVAAYRLLWAALLLAPFALRSPRREIASLPPGERFHLALAGAALALHFALWIASLSFTSVASSVLLVDTTPFFLGLASRRLGARAPGRPFWLGLALAFAGCVLIFQEDWLRSQDSMKGNLLALGGAVAMAAYLLAGARLRARLSLLAYVWPVYLAGGAILLVACLLAGSPLGGFSASSHLYLFLLGLVPQCIGHTAYNWSLRWLSPALVALVTLAEPVGAGILAWIILSEALTASKLAGGGVILAGIYLATRRGHAPAGSDGVLPGAGAARDKKRRP